MNFEKPFENMSNQIRFSKLVSKLEEYENVHDLWCSKFVTIGRQAIQSVCNSLDNEQLSYVMYNFIKLVSILKKCTPNTSLDEKNTLKLNKHSSKQNESQELLPKNDIIQMVNNDLQCPICNEWLYRATSANCNHTFCEACIQKWLKINKTCPVCRSKIQYISTSIAVDNFISNLCHLFGGFFKERRESIQNAQSAIKIIDDKSLSESIVDDTYISLLETSTPMAHPNMVRLIPQQSPIIGMQENLRQLTINQNVPHHNTVQLSPFPRSSVASPVTNRIQPIATTTLVSSRINRFQPTSSTSNLSPRVHRIQQTSTTSIVSPSVNTQPSSSTSATSLHAIPSPRLHRIPRPVTISTNDRHRMIVPSLSASPIHRVKVHNNLTSNFSRYKPNS